MSKNRRLTWAVVIVAGPALLLAAVVGLFAYMTVTAVPLHPDAERALSVAHSAPAPKWAAAVEEARRIARTGLTDQNLPGLSVAVGSGGEIVWAEGFGWSDLDSHAGVTPDTRFRIGEVSEPLASAAVGLLLAKQKLNLDDEIHTYVPDFPKKQWPVTLRQLMGQLGGLGDDPGDDAPMAPCARTLDGLRMFARNPLVSEPGTAYRPSTYGWILVSAAVEAAAGQPFFTFMRTQVFEPLGMDDTRPDFAAEQIRDRTAFYYPRFAGDTRYGPEEVREGDHSCYAAGGAFLSTPSDLVRFGMAISRGTLLPPGTVSMLQTPQRLTSGEQTDYGLGWKLQTVPIGGAPARMAGQTSKRDFIGGAASLMTFPERGIVVAVTSNISFADTSDVAVKIAQLFAAVPNRSRQGGGAD